MSAVTDLRLSVTFDRRHPKRRKLERALGSDGVLCLIDLWRWSAVNRPTGLLRGLAPDDIEAAAEWDGEPGALFAQLVALRFVDETPEGFALHDWRENQGWVAEAEARSEKARRAASVRWSDAPASTAEQSAQKCSSIAEQNAPLPSSPLPSSPSPTSPNPSDPAPTPAQSSRAWGAARFREAWQSVTASTAPIPDDVAREGADATAKSAAALGCEPAERARVLIRAFVDLEACYREAGQKGLVGHAPPSRSAAAFVRGASGRWWGEAEQWCGGWRPRFAAAPPGASRAAPGAEVAPRHYDDAKTTAAKIRAWQEDRTPSGEDAAKVKDLMRGLVASIHGAP